jgi:hypothetical protein
MDARDWIPLGVVLALLLLYLAWAFTDPTEEGQALRPRQDSHLSSLTERSRAIGMRAARNDYLCLRAHQWISPEG